MLTSSKGIVVNADWAAAGRRSDIVYFKSIYTKPSPDLSDDDYLGIRRRSRRGSAMYARFFYFRFFVETSVVYIYTFLHNV